MKRNSRRYSAARRTLREEKGISLIDVMIALGLAGIVALAIVTVIPSANRNKKIANQGVSLLETRQLLFKMLSRYDSFKQTSDAAATLVCAKNNVACPPTSTNDFIVRSDLPTSPANIVYDPTNVKSGFLDGYNSATGKTTCTATAATAPDAVCPIRANITWVPICTVGAICNPGQIKISVSFKIWDYEKKAAVNGPGMYNFELVKNVYGDLCVAPWGVVVFDGESVTAYQNPVGPCVSETRTCSNGTLSGTYGNGNCN